MPENKEIERYAFNLHKAQWSKLTTALQDHDWSSLHRGSAEEEARFFVESLWLHLCTFIPFERRMLKKQSSPWLNEKCEAAIQMRNLSEGTARYADQTASCSKILNEEYQKHVVTL